MLVVPDDMLELVDSSGELRRLVDCFRIVNPEQLTRSFKTSEWTTSTFNGVDPFITVSTAVGAGGTGKTTVSSTLAYDRVLQHKTSALVINADAQASLEQRTLSKLIYRLYHDDWGLFLELNGLQPFLNSTQLGVPTNLKDSLLTLFRLGGEYNNRIWPPKVVSVDLTRLQSSGYADTSSKLLRYTTLPCVRSPSVANCNRTTRKNDRHFDKQECFVSCFIYVNIIKRFCHEADFGKHRIHAEARRPNFT